MECHYCGKDVEGLPFRCNYCGYFFCGDHRLPENHACPKVGGPIQPGYAKLPSIRNSPRNNPSRAPTIRSGRAGFGLRYSGLFSKVEQKHVLLATALMTLVGLSLFNYALPFIRSWLLLILIPGFVMSFLGHELAHKFSAQRNGLWAEFRTNPYGLLLTALSAIPGLPFKFLAPGQVNIQGNASKEVMGSIALIGPGLNIVLGIAFIVVGKILVPYVSSAFLELAAFNGWLAVINMIPFGSLDGTRVFYWDKTRWVIALIASAVVLVLSYVSFIL
jgi:Zn-dependent protease